MPQQQTVRPAETSLGKPLKTYFHEGVYGEAEFLAKLAKRPAVTGEIYTHSPVSRGLSNSYLEYGMALATSTFKYESEEALSFNRSLAERLCLDHPDISTDPGIFGGNPHIDNVRLTVGNILGKLQTYGSIGAVAEIYAPYVTESQIKEAIAYAQDFLEEAIHAGEPSEANGRL